LGKRNENAPHHSWLVIDGSTGTNGIEQARVFNEKFGLTGLVVTKLDGTSKGGALVAIYRELKIPIFYVGLGESPDDLQPFSVDQYLDSILPEMKLEVVN
jgi:fused signal recognition particle receptor